MTDNEIIKALECCTSFKYKSCDACPFIQQCENDELLAKPALDLINRQKAEIERLYNTRVTEHSVQKQLKTAKSEAIKEFAERLKAECRQDRYAIQTSTKFGVVDKKYLRVVDESDIDNLVKEMVGDTE